MVALQHSQTPRLSRLQLYLGGFTLDTLGDLLWYVTLGWVAGRAPNGAVAGLIICAGALPALVLAPLGGALMSRIGTARATVYTMTARTAVMVVWILAIASSATPLAVLPVLAFALGCIDGLHRPALETWPMEVCADVTGKISDGEQARIAGLESIWGRLAQTGAGLLGGFLLGWGGLAAPAIAAGCLFIIALLIFRALMPQMQHQQLTRATPVGPIAAVKDLFAEAKGGFSAIRRHPVLLRSVPTHGLYNSLTAGFALAGLPLRVRSLHWDVSRFGVIYGAWAFGLLVGSVAYVKVIEPHLRRQVALASVLVILAGLLCALTGRTTSFPTMIVEAGLLGLVCGPAGPSLRGYFREQIKNRIDRGPIQGVQVLAFDGTEPFGFFVVGGLTALVGAATGCIIVGALIGLLGLWVLSSSAARAAITPRSSRLR